jgi:hypothetical protein
MLGFASALRRKSMPLHLAALVCNAFAVPGSALPCLRQETLGAAMLYLCLTVLCCAFATIRLARLCLR